MKLKKICLVLVIVLFLLLLNEIACIANYNNGANLIAEEDRRGADFYDSGQKSDVNKRGLYESSGNHQVYPSAHAGVPTFTNPGYGYEPSSIAHYYPTTGYASGHSSHGLFGHSGHGLSYGHTQTAPSHGHGGHSILALKGLLIPLAGIALLGAAAALSANPVLLQLGVVNGRRRRRRSLDSDF